MKKPETKYTSIFVFLITIFVIVVGCTGYNNSTNKTYGNFGLEVSENGKRAFVTYYHWSGNPADNVISFPKTDGDKATVEKVGGFIGTGVPCPFYIDTDDCGVKYIGDDASEYDVPVSFEDMVFEIEINDRIESFYSSLYYGSAPGGYTRVGVKQPDGSVIFYRILVTVECDPTNEYLYSKDGKLYETKDASLVELPYESTLEDNSEEAGSMRATERESYDPMEPTADMIISLDERSFVIGLEDNESAKAFWDKVNTDAPVILLQDNGNGEKGGDLPWDLPVNDGEVTAQPGDMILEGGNRIGIFYGQNTLSGTIIGHISATEDEMTEYFGVEDEISVQIFLEWTE